MVKLYTDDQTLLFKVWHGKINLENNFFKIPDGHRFKKKDRRLFFVTFMEELKFSKIILLIFSKNCNTKSYFSGCFWTFRTKSFWESGSNLD